MPGYIIHLAVGKVYSQNNEIKNLREFENGIMAPDMVQDKSKSHYGKYSSEPDLNKYIQLNRDFDDYKEGYFLHLLTDYLFYNRFLKKWDKCIYEDYDKLNCSIIKKYGISIPDEIQGIVKFSSGSPQLLDEEKLYEFINFVGKINVREALSTLENKVEIDNIIEI